MPGNLTKYLRGFPVLLFGPVRLDRPTGVAPPRTDKARLEGGEEAFGGAESTSVEENAPLAGLLGGVIGELRERTAKMVEKRGAGKCPIFSGIIGKGHLGHFNFRGA
jgi:hypothetical protein